MSRALPPVLAVLVVLSFLLFPEVSEARMAALQAHELLEVEVSVDGAEGGATQPLWQHVLERSGTPRAGGGVELRLSGAHMLTDPTEEPDVANSGVLRGAIVRGLRQFATAEYQPITILGEKAPLVQGEGEGASFLLSFEDGTRTLTYDWNEAEGTYAARVSEPWSAPDRRSVLPPLVAVALAILFRRPVLALLVGVLVGASLLRVHAGAGLVTGALGGLFDVFRTYFWDQFVDRDRAEIIGFVAVMLAMVGVMTRAGGIRGLMESVARVASSVRRTQVAAYAMGLVIFFDDYANTILVGSTMRPLTDRLKIAREKLAYIVDSTAAPVAGLSIFSTWIAFEVSTFNAQLPAAGLSVDDGYAVFIQTIPYSFYCLFTLLFVGLVAVTGRDFGPMATAERRARSTGQLIREGATPMVSSEATDMEPAPGIVPRAWRALVPLLLFLLGTLLMIAYEGGAFAMDTAALFSIEGMTAVLYDGSGSWPLLFGSALALVVAMGFGLAAGLGAEVGVAAWNTIRSMMIAFGILYLAWMIGAVCSDLGTAPFLAALLGDALDPLFLPSLLFVLAGGVSFATGSSWSTMSILLPLVVGLAFNLGEASDRITGLQLMVMSIAAVLSGSIFGDHCSPISDTTVMSSIASASDHIDHVRTQSPYALIVMAVSIVCGYLPCALYGVSPWLALAIGAAAIFAIVFAFGRRVPEDLAAR